MEPAVRIRGVMQNPVAQNYIKLLCFKRRSEQIHLHETHAHQSVFFAEFFTQSQRVQTQVGADDLTARDTEESGQLAGTATNLQNAGVVRDGFIQAAGVQSTSRFVDQRTYRVMVIVIGKRRLLVESLDDVGYVLGIGYLLVRPEQLWDVSIDRKPMSTGFADQCIAIAAQFLVATGAGQTSRKNIIRGVVYRRLDAGWLRGFFEHEVTHAEDINLTGHEGLIGVFQGA